MSIDTYFLQQYVPSEKYNRLLLLLRSHAVFFVCVFLLHIGIKKSINCFFFSRNYAISSVHILVVGNTPYGKRHISRTEPVYGSLIS